MAVTILLVRHGETAWNREKVFRGRHDIPLNDNGRAQASLLAAALAARQIDAAWTSPLARATETAAIILAPHRVRAAVHEGLTDINYGEWTELAESMVAQRWPQEYAQWLAQPETVRPPGGETLAEVSARAFAAVEDIARRHEGGTVLIVAHRAVNKVIILRMLTLGVERFPFIRQDNCCVNEFERTARDYVVVRLNDIGHLVRGGVEAVAADF